MFEDGSRNLLVLDAKAKDVVSKMLHLEDLEVKSALFMDKVIPFSEYGRHNIYKSILVSQLNSNPFLSKVRLTKVMNSFSFNNFDDDIVLHFLCRQYC